MTARDFQEYKVLREQALSLDLGNGQVLRTSGLPSGGPILAMVLGEW